jgi:hypothetical protein
MPFVGLLFQDMGATLTGELSGPASSSAFVVSFAQFLLYMETPGPASFR